MHCFSSDHSNAEAVLLKFLVRLHFACSPSSHTKSFVSLPSLMSIRFRRPRVTSHSEAPGTHLLLLHSCMFRPQNVRTGYSVLETRYLPLPLNIFVLLLPLVHDTQWIHWNSCSYIVSFLGIPDAAGECYPVYVYIGETFSRSDGPISVKGSL